MGYSGVEKERQKLLEIFKAFDLNGDGQLAFEEIVEGYKLYFDGDQERAEREARYIFEKLDFNNNGTIDYSEFLIANLDPSKIVNEDLLKEVFNIFDSDRSGAITVDEIKKLLGGAAINNKSKPLLSHSSSKKEDNLNPNILSANNK